jgi:hypothetical protein
MSLVPGGNVEGSNVLAMWGLECIMLQCKPLTRDLIVASIWDNGKCHAVADGQMVG